MTDTTDGLNGLNYERLVENALRLVVREALRIAQNDGLSGETHFFIAFDTRMPGVIMEDTLRDKHPDGITIVIQHQYADLKVEDEQFSITLFFGGKPSAMTVPFAAVTSFNDPSVGFGLQFHADEADLDYELHPFADAPADAAGREDGAPDAEAGSAEVLSLDSFRKPS